MQALSYTLRSKPDWVRKSQDSTIKEKWRSEALAQSQKTTWGAPMSSKMINYVLEELALHAERAEKGIEVSEWAIRRAVEG